MSLKNKEEGAESDPFCILQLLYYKGDARFCVPKKMSQILEGELEEKTHLFIVGAQFSF